MSTEDGILHGFLSWATACLTAGILACTRFMAALTAGIAKVDAVNAMDKRMMMAFFCGRYPRAGSRADWRKVRRQAGSATSPGSISATGLRSSCDTKARLGEKGKTMKQKRWTVATLGVLLLVSTLAQSGGTKSEQEALHPAAAAAASLGMGMMGGKGMMGVLVA